MKNFKKNILLASLTLSLLASGCGVSKTNGDTSSNNDQAIEEALEEYLVPYIEKRNALEQEIASLEEEIKKLEEQKEKLQNEDTFNIQYLDVMVTSYEGNPTELFITDFSEEYHGLFDRDDLPNFSYDEAYNLFNFLTEEEIARLIQTGGEITTSQLDEILVRLRENYHNGLYDDLFPESSKGLTLK